MTIMNQTENENILLVYLGSYIDKSEKLTGQWMAVTPEQFEEGTIPTDVDCVRVYEGKNAQKYMAGQPGAVYEVPQVKGTTSIFSSDAKYRGLWPDQDQRMEWQAAHRVATTVADLRKKSKKEGQEDNFSALGPFRRQYDKLVSQNQKAALLAQVIAYITGGGL